MWLTLKRKTMECAILALSLFSLLFFADFGICSAAPKAEEETITILKSDWIALQENNRQQKIALEESNRELSEARKALNASQIALSEAVNSLEVSQMTSSEAQEKLILLWNEYEAQGREIERLKKELAEQKKESLTAYESIARANQFLQDTREEIRENERRHAEIEGALRNRITAWQIVAALLSGYAIFK